MRDQDTSQDSLEADQPQLKNALQRTLSNEKPVAGNWISIGHTSVAEITALLEFDFGLVDTEHTAISIETVQQIVYAIESVSGPTETIVRVPEIDPVPIKRVLDTGATGIMVPMVETKDDAEKVVQAVRYPPDGIRGIAGSRATGFGQNIRDYVTGANEDVVVIVQIENEEAISNAQEIAEVDGIDALFVGPADLSGALGVFGEWDSKHFSNALEEVIGLGNEVNTPVGTLVVGERTKEFVELGVDFLIVGKDATYLADGAQEAKQEYKSLFEQREQASLSEDD